MIQDFTKLLRNPIFTTHIILKSEFYLFKVELLLLKHSGNQYFKATIHSKECVSSVTVACNSMQNGIDELSSNSNLVCYVHYHTNALGKGLNP